MHDAVRRADGRELLRLYGDDVTDQRDTGERGGRARVPFAGFGHLDEETDLGVGFNVLRVEGLIGEEEDGPALARKEREEGSDGGRVRW